MSKRPRIDIILISDSEIKKMNKRWFGRNRATDVIAFDFGEVYISIETAQRQAKERGVTLANELQRLAVHGVAHIGGFDDLDVGSFCKMREWEWKNLLNLL